jgi:hypothetical protein
VENSESKLKRKLETPVRANNFTSSDGRSNPKEKSQRICTVRRYQLQRKQLQRKSVRKN